MPPHPEGQRERIASAAACRERGLSGLSVQAVVQAADLIHGGFYAHFSSRDALVQAALVRVAGQNFGVLLRHARTRPDLWQPPCLTATMPGDLRRFHRDHPDDGCRCPA